MVDRKENRKFDLGIWRVNHVQHKPAVTCLLVGCVDYHETKHHEMMVIMCHTTKHSHLSLSNCVLYFPKCCDPFANQQYLKPPPKKHSHEEVIWVFIVFLLLTAILRAEWSSSWWFLSPFFDTTSIMLRIKFHRYVTRLYLHRHA